MHFRVTGIPQFYFFVEGQKHSEFKGANVPLLQATIEEIGEQVMSKANKHKNLNYK